MQSLNRCQRFRNEDLRAILIHPESWELQAGRAWHVRMGMPSLVRPETPSGSPTFNATRLKMYPYLFHHFWHPNSAIVSEHQQKFVPKVDVFSMQLWSLIEMWMLSSRIYPHHGWKSPKVNQVRRPSSPAEHRSRSAPKTYCGTTRAKCRRPMIPRRLPWNVNKRSISIGDSIRFSSSCWHGTIIKPDFSVNGSSDCLTGYSAAEAVMGWVMLSTFYQATKCPWSNIFSLPVVKQGSSSAILVRTVPTNSKSPWAASRMVHTLSSRPPRDWLILSSDAFQTRLGWCPMDVSNLIISSAQ